MATSLPQKNCLVLSMVRSHNQSAAVRSVHKLREKEKVIRMIGRRLAVLVLGTALGMPAGEAIADDTACQAVLDAVIKQATIPRCCRVR